MSFFLIDLFRGLAIRDSLLFRVNALMLQAVQFRVAC